MTLVSQACQESQAPTVLQFPELNAYLQRLQQESIELQKVIAKQEKELDRKDRQIELLQQRVFSLQDSDAARHQRIVKDLDNALKRYQDRVTTIRRVGAMKTVNGGDKWVLLGITEEIAEHPERTRDDGFSLVYRDDIAYRAGCSAQTVSDAYKRLKKYGVIDLDHQGKGKNERVYIKVYQEFLINPETINPTGEGKAGGKRVCPQCAGELKRKVTVTFSCENCGIDFDKDGSPIDHTREFKEQQPAPAPEPETVKARITSLLDHMEQTRAPHNCKISSHDLYWRVGVAGLECPICK